MSNTLRQCVAIARTTATFSWTQGITLNFAPDVVIVRSHTNQLTMNANVVSLWTDLIKSPDIICTFNSTGGNTTTPGTTHMVNPAKLNVNIQFTFMNWDAVNNRYKAITADPGGGLCQVLLEFVKFGDDYHW